MELDIIYQWMLILLEESQQLYSSSQKNLLLSVLPQNVYSMTNKSLDPKTNLQENQRKEGCVKLIWDTINKVWTGDFAR